MASSSTNDAQNYVYVVMNMCRGGELFDAIINRGSYTEKDAAKVIRQILGVVAHCHDMGVIHRDLKVRGRMHTLGLYNLM